MLTAGGADTRHYACCGVGHARQGRRELHAGPRCPGRFRHKAEQDAFQMCCSADRSLCVAAVARYWLREQDVDCLHMFVLTAAQSTEPIALALEAF